jgi:hypothetical protein
MLRFIGAIRVKNGIMFLNCDRYMVYEIHVLRLSYKDCGLKVIMVKTYELNVIRVGDYIG